LASLKKETVVVEKNMVFAFLSLAAYPGQPCSSPAEGFLRPMDNYSFIGSLIPGWTFTGMFTLFKGKVEERIE
jgi:hypothetical protein